MRTTATELVRLLNGVRQPIYVLDDELTITFVNRACQEWLGDGAEELVGRRCAYHSSQEVGNSDAVAAGLCPPPAVLGGQSLTAAVSCVGGDGCLRHRRARFLPLGSCADDLIGVIAILESEDAALPPMPAAPPEEAGPGELHEYLRRFRREMAGRCRPDRLVGVSPAICRARRQVELAARSRASVLLVGPPGSGRQHLASAIHYGTQAEDAGPLVPLACAILGAELIHSTITALAASGSPNDPSGRGTLVLNEADQIPVEVQCEVARVLGSRSFPLRLVATSQQPLADLVRHGQYREDLSAMLSTITIELPHLAQRREDLPLLTQVFVEEANARGSKQLSGLAPEALDMLAAYSWPGNLDELAQAVAEAHQRAAGPEIGVADLPERIRLASEAAAHPRRTEETIVLDEFLSRVERELIRRALAQAKGNKAKAARLLGLTRPRLYRRMVHLGLGDL